MSDDSGQHVLIIGAGPGLGASCARRAAAAGARVTIVARTPATVDPLVAELAAQSADIAGWCADAGMEATFRSALQRIVAERGVPTRVIYNAVDPTPKGMASTIAPDDLMQSLATNVGGALITVQEVLDPMREAGGGSIILTGGVLASKPWAQMSALSIGKAAMRSLAQCLAQELGEDDAVHLATVTIGGVIAPGTAFDPADIADQFWQICDTRDAGRGGEIIYRGAERAHA
mgnify:CR=1 FL=1